MAEEEAKKSEAAAPAPLSDKTTQAIITQVEYYFSDSNLPKDQHLQDLMRQNGGWVPVASLTKFNRLKALSEDVAAIVEALRASETGLLEINEDGTSIRRNPEKKLAEQAVIDARSIYSKGWHLFDTTIDNVRAFFEDQGYKVASVRLRRMPGSKAFKGSCFIEFASPEEAEKAAAATFKVKDDGGEEVELKVLPKKTYFEQKREERAARKKDRGDKKTKESQEPTFTPGCVISLSGLAADTSREDIKEALSGVAEVAWVDFQRGDTQGKIRLSEPKGEEVAAWGGEINGTKPTITVVTGDDEMAYYRQLEADKKSKRQKSGRGGRGGRGGRRGGYGGRGNKRGGRDRADGEPPAKRARGEED